MPRLFAPIFLLPAAALLAACPNETGQNTTPVDREPFTVPFPDSDQLIRNVESNIVMPEGAGPLESYTRHYGRETLFGESDRYGEGYVFGLLERVSDEPRTARWTEDPLPHISDGGCSVVTLRYNIANDAVEEIRCNGEA